MSEHFVGAHRAFRNGVDIISLFISAAKLLLACELPSYTSVYLFTTLGSVLKMSIGAVPPSNIVHIKNCQCIINYSR